MKIIVLLIFVKYNKLADIVNIGAYIAQLANTITLKPKLKSGLPISLWSDARHIKNMSKQQMVRQHRK